MPSSPLSSSRIVFLDIDGTYAWHGAVPEAHVAAVRQVRENGNRVLLCTGRARCAVSSRLLEAGFDGVVAGAGAYAEIDGRVLRDEVFPAALARRTIDALASYHAVSLVESTAALYALPDAHEAIEERSRRHGGAGAQVALWEDLRAARLVVDTLHGLSFAKVVTLRADTDLSVIAAAIGPEVAAVETSLRDLGRGAGELYLTHVSKAVGIAAVVEHLGLTPADVIGVGDGPNDIEMLEYAGTAVGIAGGHPDVLTIADVVADGPEHAGLVGAFAELGLI